MNTVGLRVPNVDSVICMECAVGGGHRNSTPITTHDDLWRVRICRVCKRTLGTVEQKLTAKRGEPK